MFNQTFQNKFRLCLGMLLCAIALFAAPATTVVSYAAETDIELCTNYREWMWKIEDGKLYKRLYNASTGLWETDWIYVCDWPEGA